MNKTILLTGIGFGLLAVLLGAFGAHYLKDLIPAEAVDAYKTGVQYQMYHALLLVLLGSLHIPGSGSKKWAFWCLVAGIVCFSFSLYILAISSVFGYDLGVFGLVTPLGGVLLITGWILIAYRVFRPLT